MNPYNYNTDSVQFDLKLKKVTAKWSRYSIEFASASKTPFPEVNLARGQFFMPQCGVKVPLVIFLHGLGDHSVVPCRLLAGSLVRRDVASFILCMPFHSSRMTVDMNRRFPMLTAEEWFEHTCVSVINVRQVIDWANKQPGIDSQKIGIFGISLGGFISAIVMGIDRRVKASILTVMGGNSAKISHLSSRWTRRGFNQTDDEYRHFQEVYLKYVREVAQKGFEEVIPPEKSFLTDPLTFAALLRERSVCMFNALWDEAIPRAATVEFWEACGRPPITWLPATHASIWIWYPIIHRKINRFLRSVFNDGITAK